MTTFHDPPPQSRRAVRQSERQEGADSVVGAPQFTGQETPLPAQYSFDPGPEPGASEQPPRRPAEPSQRPTSGRRAQAPAQPAEPPAQPEPLDYATQGRPGSPGFDFVPSAPSDPRPPAPPEQAGYRVRDFRPEGRRSASAPAEPSAPQPSAYEQAVPAAPTDLDYFTRGAPPAEASAPASPVAPTRGRRQASASAAPAPAPDRPQQQQPSDQTISRRQLREMRAASQFGDAPKPESIETLLESGPINLPLLAPPPGQSQALADAMAEFDALTTGARGRRAAPVQPDAPAQMEAPAQPSSPVQAQSQPQAEAAQPIQRQQQPYEASPFAAPAQAADRFVENAPQPDTQGATPIALVEPIFIEPTPPTRPRGHWSMQAELDDESQPFENTITRTVGSGSGSIATSALVLPSIPQSSVMSPFSATGAIIVTGSINLPQSLGATGAHPHRVDYSDFDEDPFDNEVISTDSAPVRAVNAVSTHTSTRGVIASKRSTGNNRMLTAMVVSASAMAVAVVGLMAVAMANGMF